MTKREPYLALDSAGETILCDYSLPLFGGKATAKKETKMAHVMTNQEVQAHAKKLVARLLGQDAALDDETAARIKEFLSDKLSDKDHTKLCAMLAGDDVEAEDEPPDTIGINPPRPIPGAPRVGGAMVGDSKDFLRRYPGLAGIRNDNSGIQPKRAARYSAADAKSFNERYPGLAHIRQR